MGAKESVCPKVPRLLLRRLRIGFQGHRGGRGGGRGFGQRSIRTDYSEVPKANELFEKYYNELGIVEEGENDEFWRALKRDLPNSFRFTGSKGYIN